MRTGLIKTIAAFPLAHWRGQVALLPSLLVTLLGLRLLIAWSGGLGVFALDGALWVWQVVGTYRSLQRHMDDLPGFGAYVATLGGGLASVIMLIYPYFTHTYGQPDALPPAPPRETGLTVEGTRATLSGPISYAMYNAFKAVLSGPEPISAVVLSSGGGHVYAARAIAQLVREHGLETRVNDTCASACILIFIAADTRYLANGARLGFHGYRLLEATPVLNPQAEQAKDRARLLERGLAPEFVAKVFETTPEQMWFPSRSELIAARVIAAP